MDTRNLTKVIGTTERSLRRLLDHQLAQAGLEFPAWTVLVALSQASAPAAQVTSQLLGGHVVADFPAAQAVVKEMEQAGLVGVSGESVSLTPPGRDRFAAVAGQVARIMAGLLEGVSEPDLRVTQNVLETMLARAKEVLSEESPGHLQLRES